MNREVEPEETRELSGEATARDDVQSGDTRGGGMRDVGAREGRVRGENARDVDARVEGASVERAGEEPTTAAGASVPAVTPLGYSAPPPVGEPVLVEAGSVRSDSVPAGAVSAGGVEAGFVRSDSVPEAAAFGGGVESGDVRVGSVQSGSVQSDGAGSGLAGSGLVESSSVQSDSVRLGPVGTGAVPAGAVSGGGVEPGSVGSDSVRSGVAFGGGVEAGSVQSGAVQSESVQSESASAGEPVSVEPEAAQFRAAQPGSAQLGSAQSGSMQSGRVQPSAVQPGSAQPGSAQFGGAQANAARAESAGSGFAQAGQTQAGRVQSGSAHSGAGYTSFAGAAAGAPAGSATAGANAFQANGTDPVNATLGSAGAAATIPGVPLPPAAAPRDNVNGYTAAPTAAPAPAESAAGHTAPPQTAANRCRKGRPAVIALLAATGLLGGMIGGGATAAVINAIGGSGSHNTSYVQLANTDEASAVSTIAQTRTPAVVTLEVSGAQTSGSGSGVIYSADGYIITNAHVASVAGSQGTIRARMSDGRLIPAKLVGLDAYADLAVVKIDEQDLPYVKIADSDNVKVGDLTVAIGAPLDLPSTVTTGVISALNRGISVESSQQEQQDDSSQYRFQLPWGLQFPNQQQSAAQKITLSVLQTDASINPGNSGGALLNNEGELIGINVAIASKSEGSVGLGFAIPSNTVKRVVDDLIAGKTPTHGLLGASVADASSAKGATHAGGLLTQVQDGSAAAQAGLQPGDVITAINGATVADGTSTSALVRQYPGDATVEITYIRNGESKTTTAKLGTLSE